MASILIIANHPILRETLRQFLFPEHRTVARGRWSEPADLQHHDVVIVDHDTLEDADGLLRALQPLKIPSVWLHQGPAPSLKPARLTATVAKPLEGAALEAALQSLLGTPPEDRPPVRQAGAEEPSGDEVPDEIIELTEVITGADVITGAEVTTEAGAEDPDDET